MGFVAGQQGRVGIFGEKFGQAHGCRGFYDRLVAFRDVLQREKGDYASAKPCDCERT